MWVEGEFLFQLHLRTSQVGEAYKYTAHVIIDSRLLGVLLILTLVVAPFFQNGLGHGSQLRVFVAAPRSTHSHLFCPIVREVSVVASVVYIVHRNEYLVVSWLQVALHGGDSLVFAHTGYQVAVFDDVYSGEGVGVVVSKMLAEESLVSLVEHEETVTSSRQVHFEHSVCSDGLVDQGAHAIVQVMHLAHRDVVEILHEVGLSHEEPAVIFIFCLDVVLESERISPAGPGVTPLASPLLTLPTPRVPDLQKELSLLLMHVQHTVSMSSH